MKDEREHGYYQYDVYVQILLVICVEQIKED